MLNEPTAAEGVSEERLAQLRALAEKCMTNVSMAGQWGGIMAAACLEVLAELDRLRSIIDTHDLCHNLHNKVDARAFADGCAAEQRKLYGCAPDADDLDRLRSSPSQPQPAEPDAGVVDALRFYADPKSYEEDAPDPSMRDGEVPVWEDAGAIARVALARLASPSGGEAGKK